MSEKRRVLNLIEKYDNKYAGARLTHYDKFCNEINVELAQDINKQTRWQHRIKIKDDKIVNEESIKIMKEWDDYSFWKTFLKRISHEYKDAIINSIRIDANSAVHIYVNKSNNTHESTHNIIIALPGHKTFNGYQVIKEHIEYYSVN